MHQHLYFCPQNGENWNIQTWMVLSLVVFIGAEKIYEKTSWKTSKNHWGWKPWHRHLKTRYSRLVTPDARSRSFETRAKHCHITLMWPNFFLNLSLWHARIQNMQKNTSPSPPEICVYSDISSVKLCMASLNCYTQINIDQTEYIRQIWLPAPTTLNSSNCCMVPLAKHPPIQWQFAGELP